jgi:hypothetical protein
MPMMKRTLVTIATILLAALVGPAVASAKLTEIGNPTAQGKPSCPTNPCLAVSRTTGFQVQGGRVKNPYLAPRAGSIVAFTVALGKPSTRQIRFFDTNLGGKSSARITILRPFARRRNNYRFVVKGQSGAFNLVPYFGQTAQFALAQSLPVNKGDLIALTVPTWAPVLALGLDSATTWRASRPKPCADNEAFQQFAQQRINAMTQYACEYKTARMTYSATLISTP